MNEDKKPDCFGYYDDGNEECGKCKYADECFKKGVIKMCFTKEQLEALDEEKQRERERTLRPYNDELI